jgi:hypothetical protein
VHSIHDDSPCHLTSPPFLSFVVASFPLLRRWGVRYLLGEYLPRHHRPTEQAYNDARASGQTPPAFDPDLYLDGNLKRVFAAGRYDVLEVLGYGFPPT